MPSLPILKIPVTIWVPDDDCGDEPEVWFSQVHLN